MNNAPQNILWMGQPFFAPALKGCGWKNVSMHYLHAFRLFSWNDLLDIAGFEPDIVVYGDMSMPPFILGMEDFPCMTVLYAVDTHIHSWLPFYAQGFDVCMVSLRDHIPNFYGPGLPPERVWWSPPYAPDETGQIEDTNKDWDCLFVGTCNESLMPKRASFLRELGRKVPGLHIETGDYRKLFPRAKVLVNHAEHGDLNFRTFEAPGCGGCLVTPQMGHGFSDIFKDGIHLLAYKPDDPDDAAQKINYLLENPQARENMRHAALMEINSRHRASHRARAFTKNMERISSEGIGSIVEKRRKNAANLRKQCLAIPYLHWAGTITNPEMKRAYLAASRGQFGQHGYAAGRVDAL